jgi:hypothetical protein
LRELRQYRQAGRGGRMSGLLYEIRTKGAWVPVATLTLSMNAQLQDDGRTLKIFLTERADEV